MMSLVGLVGCKASMLHCAGGLCRGRVDRGHTILAAAYAPLTAAVAHGLSLATDIQTCP
jgi:hypothetical protein